MKKVWFIMIFVIPFLFFGCLSDKGNDTNKISQENGKYLVSATVIDNISPSVMLNVIKASIDSNATNAFGYKAVKIVYNTTNQDGKVLKASGLLVIPIATEAYKQYLSGIGKSFSVSMICENHGTIFKNSEAPTKVEVPDGQPNYSTAVAMTGYAGFATIIPDYIGFGDTKGVVQPYIMKDVAANQAVDMIRACIKYMEDEGVVLNYQLFISGYSQGGYNAMAVAQKVQNELTNVNLMGIAAMAGPYDINLLASRDLNLTRNMVYPAFLADVANAYTYYYNDVNYADVVLETNETKYRGLFLGDYNSTTIQISLGLTNNGGYGTYTPDRLFKTSFINDYYNNINNSLKVRFDENRVDRWIPRTKINFIQCIDDEIIPFSESNNTYNYMKGLGVDATLTPIPTSAIPSATPTNPFVHSRCGSKAYGLAVKWFDNIRQGVIK